MLWDQVVEIILAHNIPIKLPTEDNASDLWCHASAFSAPEFIFMAAALVYQYIHSFTTIEITAAIKAKLPGAARFPSIPAIILLIPLKPIPIPVAKSIAAKIIAAIHSNLSCPYWCFSSLSLWAILKPIITIIVLNTSDAEWTLRTS